MTGQGIHLEAPKPLGQAEDVFEITSLSGVSFTAWATSYYGRLLELEAVVNAGMVEDENALALTANKWVAELGTANHHYAIASGFEVQATGLLQQYYRKIEGLTPMEAGRESKAYLAKFVELKKRWKAASDSLQELVWQASRVLKPLEGERRAQSRAAG